MKKKNRKRAPRYQDSSGIRHCLLIGYNPVDGSEELLPACQWIDDPAWPILQPAKKENCIACLALPNPKVPPREARELHRWIDELQALVDADNEGYRLRREFMMKKRWR